MKDITRREFTRSVLGATAIDALFPNPLCSNKHINLQRDRDEAIKEYNLRQEASDLMRKQNHTVSYTIQLDHRTIKTSNVSLKNLQEVVHDLRKQAYFLGGRGHTSHFHSPLS